MEGDSYAHRFNHLLPSALRCWPSTMRAGDG
jgi:hypothetical protein